MALGWADHSPGHPTPHMATPSGSIHPPGYESRGTWEGKDYPSGPWAPATVQPLLHTQSKGQLTSQALTRR